MTLETFFEKFDQFADAPDAMAKMRELVLRLAVQGKLVPQNPNDEPAEELLEKIAAEKLRLIKERQIRRLETAPLAQDEEPFSIPSCWIWTRLGQIGDWGSGSTPTRGNHEFYGGGIAWLKSGELNDNRMLAGSEETVSTLALKTCSFRLNQPGDVLIAMYGATIGKAAILAEAAVTNQAVCGCTPFSGVLNTYLFDYLLSQRDNFHVASEGGAQPNISKVKIIGYPFPLPPLAEQRRIVAKVDELMALCDRLEAQQLEREAQAGQLARASLARFTDAPTPSNLNLLFHSSFPISPSDLRKSILTLAVQGKLAPQDPNDESADALLEQILAERRKLKRTDAAKVEPLSAEDGLGYDTPASWRWQRLDDLLVFGPTNGFSPKAVDYETPVRSLTLSATTSGRFKGEHSKFITTGVPADSDLWLRDGDILVQRGNTIEYVGVAAVYRGKPNCFIYPDLMMKLRVASALDVGFIHLAMSHEDARDFLRARASGTSGSMPKINQTTLKSLPIPLPPLAEQSRIVAKVEQLMALVDTLETQLAASRAAAEKLLSALVAELSGTTSRLPADS
jgi:type I restriction enzyme S subunit